MIGRNILIIKSDDGFFAQNLMPWSSLDLEVLREALDERGVASKVITYSEALLNIRNIGGERIFYTSSQRPTHKKYIDDIIFSLSKNNKLLISLDCLYSHDNKGYQCILADKLGLNLVSSSYHCNLNFDFCSLDFPLVFKPVSGASSIGVKVVNNITELKKAYKQLVPLDLECVKVWLKKYVFKSRYNDSWESYLEYSKATFVLQEYCKGLLYDYKVVVLNDYYYILRRFIRNGDFRASGSGDFEFITTVCDEAKKVLELALNTTQKVESIAYSLDVVVHNGVAKLIEFQFTHIGPYTLQKSPIRFYHHNGEWLCEENSAILEDEYASGINKLVLREKL